MFRKSRSAPLRRCGKLSDTTEVSVGVLSLCAIAIRYKRIEIVLEAEVPPGTALILLDILIIFAVAVVLLNKV
jgi:hypothetical protein